MTISRDNLFLFVVMLLVVSVFFSGEALAQTDLKDSTKSFEGLLDLIKSSAGNWDEKLRGYAQTIFISLAVIQFVWLFFPLVFKQADFGEIVGELIRFIIVIGFFYALLMLSVEWGTAIVDSFRQAGAAATGMPASIRPGDMFGMAVEMAVTIGNVKTMNPLTAFMVSLAGVIVLLCFAFIAAFMALTLIESYIVINASVLFMGFGASQWTREFALAIARYAVSVGAKLFILTLLVGLIMDASRDWQAAYNHDDASMWTMVGLALTCAYFAKTIPELIAALISGSSAGGGGSLGGMAAAVAAGAAAATATIATAGVGAAAAGAATTGSGGGIASTLGSMQAGGGGAGLGSAASSASGASGASSAAPSAAGSNLGGASRAAASPNAGGSAASAGSGGSGGSGGAARKAANAASQNDSSRNQGPQSAPGGGQGDQGQQSAPDGGQGDQGQQSAPGGEQAAQGSDSKLNKAALASGALRTTGVLSAISVPGMEGAAGLSLGVTPEATPPPSGDMGEQSGDMSSDDGPSNTIRPANNQPPTREE